VLSIYVTKRWVMSIIDSLKALFRDLTFSDEETNDVISGDAKTEIESIIRFLNKDSLIKKD
jgi:hypothetical protein